MADNLTNRFPRFVKPIAEGPSSPARPFAMESTSSRKMNAAAKPAAMKATSAKTINRTVELTVLDEDGDLIIQVSAETSEPERAFQVCASTMRRASPVWKRMLFGPWIEAKPSTGEWVVALPEDKPSPLSVLLGIIHGKFQFLIPSWRIASHDFAFVSDVLVVADKYDLFDCLRPWAADWLFPVESDSKLTGHEVLQRMDVVWELGSQDKLSYILKTLIFVSTEADIEELLDLSAECHLHGLPSVLGDFLGMCNPNPAGPKLRSGSRPN